jgi:hypothetical protein
VDHGKKQGITILVLLDLSAAFDTIDHKVLLARMEELLGVQDIPLKWFASYLSGRTQRLHINNHFSQPRELLSGVPQGSVLGPLLFLIYTLPLGQIIRKHGLELHMCADDTQIYTSICPVKSSEVLQNVSNVEDCITEVQAWMSTNFLKLNADKTEVIAIGFRAQLAKFHLQSVKVAGVDVLVETKPVRNLGVMFDPAMTMSAQVSSIIKTANFYLTNIGRARRLLTVDATKLAVHTLVTSRLDYCNSLLIGISQKLKRRLNNVQRTAARLITKKRKFDSITPELIKLHWLPIH